MDFTASWSFSQEKGEIEIYTENETEHEDILEILRHIKRLMS